MKLYERPFDFYSYRHKKLPRPSSGFKNVLRVIEYNLTKHMSKKAWWRIINIILKKDNIDECKYIGDIYGLRAPNFLDKEMYATYEGDEYPIPAEYDLILKSFYGNYMEYPPEEERKPEFGNLPYILAPEKRYDFRL